MQENEPQSCPSGQKHTTLLLPRWLRRGDRRAGASSSMELGGDDSLLWIGLTVGASLSYCVLSLAGDDGGSSDGPEFRTHMRQAPGAVPDKEDHAPFEFERLPEDEMISRAVNFHELLKSRRSVRFFSTDPVPLAVVSSAVSKKDEIFD